jgi:hypothetical protein
MLYELYTYFTTPCPQYVRHMDYLYEAIAMRRRYQRNRTDWQPHLEQTHRTILSAAEKTRTRDKVVILGSGPLLDVPLHELAAMFHEVVLVDIVFLPEVYKRIKPYANVRLVQHDVTNMAQRLYENLRSGQTELPLAAPAVPDIDNNTGLVISLNILSQLWVMPRAYALKKLRGLEEENVDDWCNQITGSHYAFLQQLTCPVCLIGDHEFVKRDREGRIVSQGSTIAGLALPDPEDSWTWNIVPLGEKDRFLSKELKVGVWQMGRN